MNTQTRVRETVAPLRPAAQLPAVMAGAPPHQLMAPAYEPPAPISYSKDIVRALIAVQRKIGGVAKRGWNDFHKYHYPKWEDVLSAVAPLLNEHKLFIQQSEVNRSLFDNDTLLSITYQFTIFNDDAEVWPAPSVFTAISRLKDSKGVYDDKAANKCHTQAHKYFFLHTFQITTDDTVNDDNDADKTDGSGRRRPPSASGQPQGPYAIDVRGMSYQSFADGFLNCVLTAKRPEEFAEWFKCNGGSLRKLELGDADLYAGLVERLNKHAAEITGDQQQVQAQSQKRKPPSASAPAQDPDVAAVEAGRDDGRQLEDIPGFLRRDLQDSAGDRKRAVDEIDKCRAVSDLNRLAGDREFQALIGNLLPSDRTAVDLAYMQRKKVLADAKK